MNLARYKLAGAFVGLALGVGHAVDVFVPQEVHKTFSNLVKVRILVPLCSMADNRREFPPAQGCQWQAPTLSMSTALLNSCDLPPCCKSSGRLCGTQSPSQGLGEPLSQGASATCGLTIALGMPQRSKFMLEDIQTRAVKMAGVAHDRVHGKKTDAVKSAHQEVAAAKAKVHDAMNGKTVANGIQVNGHAVRARG